MCCVCFENVKSHSYIYFFLIHWHITIRALLIFIIKKSLSWIIKGNLNINPYLKLKINLSSLLILKKDRFYYNIKGWINSYYIKKIKFQHCISVRTQIHTPKIIGRMGQWARSPLAWKTTVTFNVWIKSQVLLQILSFRITDGDVLLQIKCWNVTSLSCFFDSAWWALCVRRIGESQVEGEIEET